MKYNFSGPLLTADGDVMTMTETDATPFTAKRALARALCIDTQANDASKLDRFDVFVKLTHGDTETEFSADEAKLMRDAALTLPTIMAGQLVYLIDQRTASSG